MKWIKALKSGEYKRGRGELVDSDNHFCCLGVLTDLYMIEHDIKGDLTCFSEDGTNSYPAQVVMDWAKLSMKQCIILGQVNDEYKDSKKDFIGIVDSVEKILSGTITEISGDDDL